jgi:hypothetical protein
MFESQGSQSNTVLKVSDFSDANNKSDQDASVISDPNLIEASSTASSSEKPNSKKRIILPL